MKFIFLISSAVLCFSGIESLVNNARLVHSDTCKILERLSDITSSVDRNGRPRILLGEPNGVVSEMVRLPFCDNINLGVISPQVPTEALASQGSMIGPSVPIRVLAAASSGSSMSARFEIGGSTLSAPGGFLGAIDASQVAGTVAIAGGDSITYLLAARLGLSGSTANVLQGSVGTAGFSAIDLGKILESGESLAWIAANPTTNPNGNFMIAAINGASGSRVAKITLKNSENTIHAVQFTSVSLPATSVSVRRMAISSDNNIAVVLDNTGALQAVSFATALGTSKQLTPPGFAASRVIHVADIIPSSSSALYGFASIERGGFGREASLVLREIGIDASGVPVAVHITSTKLKASITEAIDLATVPSSATATLATGFISVISNSDPRSCFWENQKVTELYRRCMRKCCEAAECGHPHCPSRCELESECPSNGFFDPRLNGPLDEYSGFDNALVRIDDGFDSEFQRNRYDDCECSDDSWDECKDCGGKKELRNCKCCCRRYLRPNQCFRTLLETFQYVEVSP